MPAKCKNPLLKDKKWLNEEYTVKRQSLLSVSKLIGLADGEAVRNALIANGIRIRAKSNAGEAIDDGFRSDNLNVIDGCLLGDASLTRIDTINGNSRFVKRNINFDHLLYVANGLGLHNPESLIKQSDNISPQGKLFKIHYFSTKFRKEITELRHRWYPDGIKIVPIDIEIDATALLHWFMDDGSSFYVKNVKTKKIYPSQVVVKFSSQSFSYEDHLVLKKKLENLGLIAGILSNTTNGTGHAIILYSSQTRKFFEIIGACPVPSMAYKWKIPEPTKHIRHDIADKNWLIERYVVKQMPINAIAREAAASRNTIKHWLIHHKLYQPSSRAIKRALNLKAKIAAKNNIAQ